MKSLFGTILLAATLSSAVSHAKTYSCQDIQGNVATLNMFSLSDVSWNEVSQSASSSAKYIGLDDAPYSETKGFMLFRLTDFYTTNDSSFVLALKRAVNRAEAVVYFDNDGHSEQETKFSCIAD